MLNYSHGNTTYTNDHIYYNVNIKGSGFRSNKVQFEENRVEPLVLNPSDYYLTISRFRLPGATIPIYIMPIIPNAAPTFNTNPNLTPFTVTLNHNGDISTANLIYTPELQSPFSPPPIPNVGDNWPKTPYYYVQSINNTINMINTAFATAFAGLAAPPVGAIAPYVQFNNVTQLSEFVVLAANYVEGTAAANKIEIYTNEQLSRRFLNGYNKIINSSFGPDRMVRYTIYDTPQNYYNPPNLVPVVPPVYILKKQDFKTIQFWFDITELVFLSNTLPILAEYQDAANNNGKIIKIPILTDFVPLLQNSGDQKGIYVYTPSADIEYRLINLISTSPLIKFDFSVFWKDKDEELHPVYLNEGYSMSMKFLFKKKTHSSYVDGQNFKKLKRNMYI